MIKYFLQWINLLFQNISGNRLVQCLNTILEYLYELLYLNCRTIEMNIIAIIRFIIQKMEIKIHLFETSRVSSMESVLKAFALNPYILRYGRTNQNQGSGRIYNENRLHVDYCCLTTYIVGRQKQTNFRQNYLFKKFNLYICYRRFVQR